MSLVLDHFTVASRDRHAAARLLARILGVDWAAETGTGPFSAVYASDDLTLWEALTVSYARAQPR